MNARYVYGLIDPRDHRIFHVGTLPHDVALNEHVADEVAEAVDGAAGPTHDRVRAILAADFDAPHAVILQPQASETDAAGWVERLKAAGNALV